MEYLCCLLDVQRLCAFLELFPFLSLLSCCFPVSLKQLLALVVWALGGESVCVCASQS